MSTQPILQPRLVEVRQKVLKRNAALVEDLATDNDAVRLVRSMAPVRQIATGTICHLDAEMAGNALPRNT